MQSPSDMAIRQATEDDAAAMRSLIRATWKVAYAHIYDAAAIDGVFEGKISLSCSWSSDWAGRLGGLVAERQDRLLGVARFVRCTDGEGELTHLYVLPEAQGAGVGLALWQASLDVFRQHQCPAMHIWVLAKGPAVPFYANRGAVLTGEGVVTLGEQEERALCYRLSL